MYLTDFHKRWPSPYKSSASSAEDSVDALRAVVGQRDEARLMYAAGAPRLAQYIATYAMSTWVYTAVARLAEMAASAAFLVQYRDRRVEDDDAHPLAAMLGAYGSPNGYQSSFEFWEDHFTWFELAGNVYWYLEAPAGGAPTSVHLLHPASIRIIPGVKQHVKVYEYAVQGNRYELRPEQIIHFRRPNPYSRYYGLPALEALMMTIMTDHAASKWNHDFFGDGVGIPAGILMLPPGTSDADRDRVDREFNSRHAAKRRTAVVRGDVSWSGAGLSHQDADYLAGRQLTRQEVYEALDLPLGYMSEASTEAHARVAERRFMHSIHRRHQRTAAKLNSGLIRYFAGWRSRRAAFEDIRKDAADWDQLSKRYRAISQYLTRDEIRAEIGYEPDAMEGGNDAGDIRDNAS